MKRNIFFYALSMLFFVAMNFGMNVDKVLADDLGEKYDNRWYNAASYKNFSIEHRYMLMTSQKNQSQNRIPQFKPGKPLRKIVNQEDSQNK
jgi:hypothetical protein